MKTRLPRLAAPLAVALALTACSSNGAQSSSPAAPGTIAGMVSFMGTPCPPDPELEVPPCEGPYPGYEVTVMDADGNEVATATTDDEGHYELSLPPGNYAISVQRGPMPDNHERHEVSVQSSQTTELDLQVDTGVR